MNRSTQVKCPTLVVGALALLLSESHTGGYSNQTHALPPSRLKTFNKLRSHRKYFNIKAAASREERSGAVSFQEEGRGEPSQPVLPRMSDEPG